MGSKYAGFFCLFVSFAYGRCTAEHKLKLAKAPALLMFFLFLFFLLCKSLKMGKEIVNIRITVNDVLSCVSCIAIMVLLEVWLDKKKMP